jgi:two-component system, OmpR family, phosphate regulon sensor histidine kinase PhoR
VAFPVGRLNFARVRRPWLLYLLIPAVLVGTSGLAYYSFQLQTRERQVVMDTMRELAEEKVIGIRTEIERAERELFNRLDLENIQELRLLLEPQALLSVLVLNDRREIVPSGHHSKRQDTRQFEELFSTRVLPDLRLDQATADEPRYHHEIYEGLPYLFSYVHRYFRGKLHYVVVEHDLNHLVAWVFPQFFPVHSRSLYQVMDERGQLVYGFSWTGVPESEIVQIRFPVTLRMWRLRVAQKDGGALSAGDSRRITVDLVLIGLALTTTVAGLAGLVLIVGRERRLNELKSEFISNVSHELKTPLSIISMFCELLSMGRVRSPEQATEYAEIIRRESVRLSRLIDNVLDFAKIERGVGVYEFSDGADLGEVVANAFEISRPRLERAEMEAALEVEEGLPAARLDRNAMTLAVLNLVDNAIKYAIAGKRIELSLGAKDAGLELVVRDHGPGIPVEEQSQVFERFYRAQAVRLKPIRGSGIGLALVKHIAEAHGGSVKVETAPSGGCLFRVWIPAEKQVK